MHCTIPILLAAAASGPLLWLVGALAGIVFAIVVVSILVNYFGIWFRAYMSSANISLLSLIGMSFRRVDARIIVQGKIMAVQAGIGQEKNTGVTTRRLEALYLAGGNVPNVIKAIIAAHRADIDLDFDRAAAIDLAGRDVLDAVQTSVYPKVIDCPDPEALGPHHPERHRQERRRVEGPRPGYRADEHRAVDRRGNRGDDHRAGRRGDHHGHRLLDQPPAGDGESRPHLEGRAQPRPGRPDGLRDRLDRHRRHRRGPEHRRPAASRPGRGRHPRGSGQGRGASGVATAREQEMKAQVARNRAQVVLAEAEVPLAMAAAFREGNLAGK